MSSNDKDIVSALVAALSARLGTERFTAWFGRHVEFEFDGACLRVLTPEAVFVEWLRDNFREVLDEICAELGLGETAVQFGVREAAADPKPVEAVGQPALQLESELPTVPLLPIAQARRARDGQAAVPRLSKVRQEGASPRRRFAQFASFVVGDSNRVAHTAAQLVAREPGRVSPLVIYGPPGVGKSHLLEAIWTELRTTHRGAHLIYQRAAQFTTQFLDALHSSGMPAFRRKYRGAQLLILDDLQFFNNKRATLNELLHLIDQLRDTGGQVVFGADRSPSELTTLGPELASRLQGSMVCRVELADEPTRRGILQRLAAEHGLRLGDEVELFVASRLRGDGRELAGAVHRLRLAVEATGRAIDVALAGEVLGDLFVAAQRPVQLPEIEQVVCELFGLQTADMQSKRRTKDVTHPRMLAMYLARQLTGAAFSEIGDYFGQRAHTTVISATNKVSKWREDHRGLRLNGSSVPVEELVRRVEGRLRTG